MVVVVIVMIMAVASAFKDSEHGENDESECHSYILNRKPRPFVFVAAFQLQLWNLKNRVDEIQKLLYYDINEDDIHEKTSHHRQKPF